VISPLNPPAPPLYEFEEQELFARDRARLVAEGVSEEEIDAHLFAIQDSIGPDPFQEPWSRPIPMETPGNRSAVSSATLAEPNALVVVFRVKGNVIKLWRVRRRD
jgi:hypothetical protein